MNMQSILTALSLTTASMIFFIGIILLSGYFLPEGIPVNYRYTLGGLMTLYTAYRIASIWYKIRRKSALTEVDVDDNSIDADQESSPGQASRRSENE